MDTRLVELVTAEIRAPKSVSLVNGVTTLQFDPPLTPAEQATLDALQPVARSAIRLDRADYASIAAELDGLRTYHGLASPTAAQTAAATKAIIRVLRAILRD